ncbi:phosphoribosylamine--glycine ligase [Aridibaculum aurantiacum]|uniref:phosphoribosylamine--glycine ligase n=1 Tax=Aridibaculum aurantiacum TaxID=2810307 RepID=UPI001A97BFC9|nr:phosphoribosylamine--glycine ligase [Aridibaculum aurantiacum]
MNILLLGSGGREHALARALRYSKTCSRLLIAPGNAGTTEYGENVDIQPTDFEAIKTLCITQFIEMIVVGPEEPLVKGIYDFVVNDPELEKITVVGPSAGAAQLEGSKSFSKKFMQRYQVPTAGFAEFNEGNFEHGKNHIHAQKLPIVLKADGLAAGKGVIICDSYEEATKAFEEMVINKQFGEASEKVVVEEFLQGIELSVFVVTNGSQYKIIGHAKDYKRIGEGDTGLNTGGMGCVTPVPFANDEFMQKVEERVIKPTIRGLQEEQLAYNGFIFFGLMNVNGDPYVIEYNCRLGDPETEVILPRLKTDLLEILTAMRLGRLDDVVIEYDERAVATVVAVSEGYPGKYEKGRTINGLPADTNQQQDTIIFHAGTKTEGDTVVTNGGRVLAVTSFGTDISEAVKKSKAVLDTIHFEGMTYRKDIGYEFE